MANHNYSQYSNNKKHHNNKNTNYNKATVSAASIAHETKIEPAVPIKLVNETVETVTLPETVEGIVVNCGKLNVREEPSITAEIVTVLAADSELEIDINKSNHEWFRICTAAGIEGYCMRKFISAQL